MTNDKLEKLNKIASHLRTLGKALANVHESERDDDLAASLYYLGEQISEITDAP
jgi:hypothetical protein